jgi:hypothetical protein
MDSYPVRWLLALGAILILIGMRAGQVGAGMLLVNGDFETGDLTGWSELSTDWTLHNFNAPVDLGQVTVVSTDIALVPPPLSGMAYFIRPGDQSPDAGLSQSVSVVAGESYSWGVDIAARDVQAGFPLGTFEVRLNGMTVASLSNPASGSTASLRGNYVATDSAVEYSLVFNRPFNSFTSNPQWFVDNAFLADTNLINNPGFETDTKPWVFYTNGAGTFAANAAGPDSAKAAHVTLTTPGTNVQLYQHGLALEANTKYRLSFKAYSNTGHDLSVSILKHGAPYTSYGLSGQVFNLTRSWQKYGVVFTTKNFTGTVNDGRLMFWLAPYDAAGDQYFFDDVVVEKVVPRYEYSDYEWRWYNGHMYAATFVVGSWQDAKAEADAVGGHLAIIDDDLENAWLTAEFDQVSGTTAHSGYAIWIGMEKIGEDWKWVDGQSPAFWNVCEWCFREAGSHMYLHTASHPEPGTWNYNVWHDNYADHYLHGIIELDTPLPTLINNPGFEAGTTPWVFYTNGAGTFANNAAGPASAKAAHISINTPGTNVQLYQSGLALEANTKYRLRFKAYSNTGHDVSVSILKHGSPYTNYGLSGKVFNLTSSWQNIVVEFTTKNITGTVNDGRLMFWLAPYDAAGDQYYFDDVVLEKVVP